MRRDLVTDIEQRRARVVQWLRHDKQEYERTSNPVFAWEAITACLAVGMELPTWTQEYLFTVGANITSLSRSRVPRKNRVAQAVASAVGLTCHGRKNPFDGLRQPGHELMIAMNVYQCHTDNWWNQRRGLEGTHNWKVVYEAGAVRHNETCDCGRTIGWKTAERYFRKHAKVVIPRHLQQQSKSQKLADILR